MGEGYKIDFGEKIFFCEVPNFSFELNVCPSVRPDKKFFFLNFFLNLFIL